MATKIYPRLERKKLKKIKEGKRPFDNLEDKAIFTSAFEKGMYNNYGVFSLVLNGRGDLVCDSNKAKLLTRVPAVREDDDDDWLDDDNDGVVMNAATITKSVKKPDDKSDFADISFDMADAIKLREAYFQGKLATTFAKMVESKSKQGGTT